MGAARGRRQRAEILYAPEMNQLYRWIALNSEALAAAQSGQLDTVQLVERLKKL